MDDQVMPQHTSKPLSCDLHALLLPAPSGHATLLTIAAFLQIASHYDSSQGIAMHGRTRKSVGLIDFGKAIRHQVKLHDITFGQQHHLSQAGRRYMHADRH